jgi:nitrogen fixation NifU-like protein
MASASMMTQTLRGKTLEEGAAIADGFHALVTGTAEETPADLLDKLVVFAGVREFPVRVKCATLSWHTLRAALDRRRETISTE